MKSALRTAPNGIGEHVARVRAYYDRVSPIFLDHIGPTFQGGLVSAASFHSTAQESNQWIAARAEIGGECSLRILDAGCGVCGPAIDIAFFDKTVQIDAITISPVQHRLATERVRIAGLEDRVRVTLGDFHSLPFSSGTFDRVLFLESAGHRYDPGMLYSEALRVLVPGGLLYIKDLFRREGISSDDERIDLSRFETTYLYTVESLSETLEVVKCAGFVGVRAESIESITSTEHYRQAMTVAGSDPPRPTKFGEIQIREYGHLPCDFGDVRAERPRTD